MKTNAAFAVFKKQEEVDQALRELSVEGFNREEVSVILPEHDGDKDFATSDHVTRVAQGAEWGAGFGLMIGIGAGLVAGAEAFGLPFFAELSISPALGAFIGGLFGALTGAGSGALVGIGTPASPSSRYARYLDDGGILISVHAEDRARCLRAMDILERCGGSDISPGDEHRVAKNVSGHGHAINSAVLT